jgi:[CysO sulfur-carrier protein]-S-L-cysteine hydrolase
MTQQRQQKHDAPLILPRRLAIALLAEAQKAAGEPVHGLIDARDGVPTELRPAASPASGAAVWARYRSGATEPDNAPGRQLLISLDTKGVLQLRCWERGDGAPVERELHII